MVKLTDEEALYILDDFLNKQHRIAQATLASACKGEINRYGKNHDLGRYLHDANLELRNLFCWHRGEDITEDLGLPPTGLRPRKKKLKDNGVLDKLRELLEAMQDEIDLSTDEEGSYYMTREHLKFQNKLDELMMYLNEWYYGFDVLYTRLRR